MSDVSLTVRDEQETQHLGGILAAHLPSGSVVALNGELGAGKTRLVRAIADACDVAEQVVSPTFVLCQHYHGEKTLYHLDAYRIGDEDEFWQLGVEEYFDSEGVTLIEWADRVRDCLPEQRLEIEIENAGETERRIRVAARGEGFTEVMQALEDWS